MKNLFLSEKKKNEIKNKINNLKEIEIAEVKNKIKVFQFSSGKLKIKLIFDFMEYTTTTFVF